MSKKVICSQYFHGGPIFINEIKDSGYLQLIDDFDRQGLINLRNEIDRWLKSHSGECVCCGFDQGPYPDDE